MPLTIQAIVCAVDLSPFSPLVVGHGLALARRTGGRLYLFHAVHEPQDNVHPTTVFERGGDLAHVSDNARQRIDTLMAHATVEWESVVRYGDPVEQTVAFVENLPPCIVISASHGVSGFRRLFIGTVVERLTRALNCPMLVVKPAADDDENRFDGFFHAVVSCDDHGYWQRLAPLLSRLQPDTASRIHMVHAMERPMNKSMPDTDTASYGQAQQELQESVKHRLLEQARQLFPHAETLSAQVAPGVPQEMVLQVVREQASDIIVVGVRRSAKVGRWISGSTTEALLRRAPCSVLAVPNVA